MDLKCTLAVLGYIRENFDKKFRIEEIVAIIIQFYKIDGGSLYVCGNAFSGQLVTEKYKSTMCKTATLWTPFTSNNAHKVSVSLQHTLVLDVHGDVWSCGNGNKGQLGNGKTDFVYLPTKLNLEISVVAVSAGKQHSLLLSSDGTVKGFGDNGYGQIGLGDLKQTLVPKTIERLKQYKIIHICAGSYHSAALTEDGVLFCFGSNSFGQTGVGEVLRHNMYIKNPAKVDLNDEIEFVDCGNNHTLIITRKASIYLVGYCHGGQLGKGNAIKYVPELIEELKEKRMKTCAAGSKHSLCIDEDGIIWSFGRNHRGQCGLSEDIKTQKTPIMIEWFIENNIKAKECAAGYSQSSVIATDGNLYLFGDNATHQLGLEKRAYFTPCKVQFPEHGTVQTVSMGAKHTAIIFNSL